MQWSIGCDYSRWKKMEEFTAIWEWVISTNSKEINIDILL